METPSFSDFGEPLSFGAAKRIRGMVATSRDEGKGSETSKGVSQQDDIPSRTSLERQKSMAGHVLVLEKGNEKFPYLLQRKLEQVSPEIAVRVGYPLHILNNGGKNLMEESATEEPSNLIWSVDSSKSVVAIHIYSETSNSSEQQPPSRQSLSLPNPRAEWYVWQKLAGNPLFLQGSLLGRETNSSQAICYGVTSTPLYSTTCWDFLCRRRTPLGEEEALRWFAQLVDILVSLKQYKLWHRHISLHNLLIAQNTPHEPFSYSSGDAKPSNPDAAAPENLQLSKHGWALKAPSSDSKSLVIPSPPTTLPPLYVAPEWPLLLSGTVDTSLSQKQEEQEQPTFDPYALDLWSASICLLLSLTGGSTEGLYTAPVLEDPRFKAFPNTLKKLSTICKWSLPLQELMTGLLQIDARERWSLERVQTWMASHRSLQQQRLEPSFLIKVSEDLPTLEECYNFCAAEPSCGAVSTFVGITRDNFQGKTVKKLSYEGYVPMAEKELMKLCRDATQKFPSVRRIAAVHILGDCPVSKASVILAAASPHRKDSIDCSEYLINELKARIPIWKLEVYEGDEEAVWKENIEWHEGKKRRIMVKQSAGHVKTSGP